MNLKPLILLMLIMLVLGCADDATWSDGFDVSGYCSRFDDSHNCSGDYNYLNGTMDAICIDYLIDKCKSDNHEIISVPKPTLVTGYTHSESGWYPLRGTWINPNSNYIINNTIWIGNSLYIYEGCDNVTVRYSTFSANLSITNSTNIVVAYANITRNINITNMRDFKLLGAGNMLYYLNETPVSEMVVNDTIIFTSLVKEPKAEDMDEGIDVFTGGRHMGGGKITLSNDNENKNFISYEITVYGMGFCSYITPCEIESAYTYDCRDVAKDYWRYNYTDDNPFNWAFDACKNKFPELIQAEIDKQEQFFKNDNNGIISIINSTWISANISFNLEPFEYSFDSVIGNITFHNSSCHRVECPCYEEFGCLAYCLECEEIK